MKKDEFLELVAQLYAKFYIMGEYNKSCSIKELERFYDLHPQGSDGLNILLMN